VDDMLVPQLRLHVAVPTEAGEPGDPADPADPAAAPPAAPPSEAD
jgi:hypothetical protein